MSRIVIFQRDIFVQDSLRQGLAIMAYQEGQDFVLPKTWDLVEPEIHPDEIQLLITGSASAPGGVQQLIQKCRDKNSKLFVASLSSIDLGKGFDYTIKKHVNFFPELLEVIRQFDENWRRYQK